MLHNEILAGPGAAEGGPVVVLLHGRGADHRDLAGLQRAFPGDATLVLPRGPFEAAPWGYGPGWAWYRYLGEDRVEEESFRTTQQAVGDLLEGLSGLLGREPGPVFLGGFSQGGTTSIGYALRRPGSVAGVLNFSGFLPRHPDIEVTSGSVGGTPFFWGHGTMDPAIPFAMAQAGRERLKAAGADLDARDYRMGHGILPTELADAVDWMERVSAA